MPHGRIRCPREVLTVVPTGEHLAAVPPGNSQYSLALQQMGVVPRSVWQIRLPEQHLPPWQISFAKHWLLVVHARLAGAQTRLPPLRTQTCPFLQHVLPQQAVLAQHLPPQTLAP